MNPPSANVHALLHAKLEALLAEFDTVADHAAYGETINDLDAFLLIKGRAFIKDVFEQKLQERIAQKEQTQEATQCPECKKKTQTHDTKTKNVVSAHGHIHIHQRYKHCPHCAARSYPFESELGIDHKYTKPLKSLVSRCCCLGSYRVAEDNLREL